MNEKDDCISKKYQKIYFKADLCEDVPLPSLTSIKSFKINKKLTPRKTKTKKIEDESPDKLCPEKFKFDPDSVIFSNYTTGESYKKFIKATNVSNKIGRFSVTTSKSKVFTVSIITGSQHREYIKQLDSRSKNYNECCIVKSSTKSDRLLESGVWAAAPGTSLYLKVVFSPTNEHGDKANLVLNIQEGEQKTILLEAFNFAPIIDGYILGGPLERVPSKLSWNCDRGDVLELGVALVGGEVQRELILQNQGGKAGFFIMLEETWLQSLFQEVDLNNILAAPPFTIFPIHFTLDKGSSITLHLNFKPHCPCSSCGLSSQGHACRGCNTCPQCKGGLRCDQDPDISPRDTAAPGCSPCGLHFERLAIVCTNGMVRYAHIIADAIQFPRKPLKINLPKRVYDIDIDGDNLCQHFLDLGVIFPRNTCNINFTLENISGIPIEIRWVWRQSNASNRTAWPHRVTGCCGDQCEGFCANRCGGLCHMSPQGGVIKEGASFPVDMEVKSEGFEPGKYSAVLGVIIMGIPEPSFPVDFGMKRFITTKYSLQNIESTYVAQKYDLLAYEIEVWLEVKLPEVFIDPCVIPLLSEPVLTKSPAYAEVERFVKVVNLSKSGIGARWTALDKVNRAISMEITPIQFDLSMDEEITCVLKLTVTAPLQAEETIVLDINEGMLQKSLMIQIKTAPPKMPLLPFRNLRIEYLERSDQLGTPPYIAPIAFLSLPDILFVNQKEDVMVVLRNNTPVSMNYVWGESIGDNTDDLDVSIIPPSGLIMGHSTQEVYLYVLPKRRALIKDFVIPCTVGETEQILPLGIACFVENLRIEFKIQREFDESYDLILDWVSWSKKLGYFEEDGVSDVNDTELYPSTTLPVLSSNSIDGENSEESLSHVSDEIFPMEWYWQAPGEDDEPIPGSSLIPYIELNTLLPLFYLFPKIEINDFPLDKVVSRTILIRNKTPIRTFFNVSVDNYQASLKNRPEDIVREIDAKINGLSYVGILPQADAGFGILAQCNSSQLSPYGIERIQIHMISDTWGIYTDTIRIQVDGLAPLPIRVMTKVTDRPLKIADSLRFGTQLFEGPNVKRHLKITNTSSVPIFVNWHVFEYEDKALPFSLMLNINNKNSWPLFLMPEPDEVQHPPQTVFSNRTSFGEYTTNSEQNSRVSLTKGSSLPMQHAEMELGGDYKNHGQSLPFPRLSKRKKTEMSGVSFKSVIPKDKVFVSSNSSESDRKHSLRRLNTPASLKSTFTVTEIYSDIIPKPEELEELYDGESFKDDLSNPSTCNDDQDTKIQLYLTEYCGRPAEDGHFMIEPRHMMLYPGKGANLAVTLMTTENRDANNIKTYSRYTLDLERTLVGSVQCKEYRTEELYRLTPPLTFSVLSARIILPKVTVCDAEDGIIFTIHAVTIFRSARRYLSLSKSLTIYNPHESAAEGTIGVESPFSLKSENQFTIPPESSMKVKVECLVTTLMCLKGCHELPTHLETLKKLTILQHKLDVQTVTLKLNIIFPELRIEPSFVDFGQCPENESITGIFKVENLTDQEMELTVSIGQDCTTVWTLEPCRVILEPMRCGGVKPATFYLTFFPGLRKGTLDTTVTIHTPVPHCSYKVPVTGEGISRDGVEQPIPTIPEK